MNDTGVTLKVRLQPRASSNKLDGMHGDALKVRVTAPPIEGKANKALTKFIAEKLGIASSGVKIVSGLGSSNMVLKITDVTQTEMETALGICLHPV